MSENKRAVELLIRLVQAKQHRIEAAEVYRDREKFKNSPWLRLLDDLKEAERKEISVWQETEEFLKQNAEVVEQVQKEIDSRKRMMDRMIWRAIDRVP